ncbi:MAG: cupin domain-containing protein [Roseiarcus sp.]
MARSGDRLPAPAGFCAHNLHGIICARKNLPLRQRVTMPAQSYALIREVAHVLEGRLVVEAASRRHELAAGDSLGFGAPEETTFANETDAPAAYLVVLARS